MADQRPYTKKRMEFGRHATFEDTETKIVGGWQPEAKKGQEYCERNPNKVTLDNIPNMSEHKVNTERIATNNRGMKHVVGGWPKELDYTEANDVTKYIKKLNRDTTLGYAQATKDLVGDAKRCIQQNNQIDLFEEYFEGEQPEYLAENISTKTVMIFKDPSPIKRAITKIAWYPEATSEMRVGAAYATLRFQQMPHNMPKASYIWNLKNPNFPDKTLEPPSPLCTMVFNHKSAEIMVGGSYNGSLSFFDQRKGNSAGVMKPTETTLLDKSHHDPVYDIYWSMLSKTGTECVSTSTDGRILWWDMKKLGDGPIEELTLKENITVDGKPIPKILGATTLEYTADSPLKYLIGTEQGYILQATKRKQVEVNQRYGLESGKHHGPVYSVTRNPAHPKYFLSVGDWSAKVWSDDLKSPIMQTRYHHSYLTDGCWSPTRAGLFFLTRQDGFLDVWDFFYRQNEIAYSQKISDAPLNSISVMGSMAAVGDAEGTVHMMSLCRTLYDQTLQPKEKEIMFQIFERESRREKNLEIAKRMEQQKKPSKEKAKDEAKIAKELQDKLNSIEEKFFNHVADGDEQHMALIQQRAAANNPAAEEEEPEAGVAPVEGKEYTWKGQMEETVQIEFGFTVENESSMEFTNKSDQGAQLKQLKWVQDGDCKFVVQIEDVTYTFKGKIQREGDKLVLDGRSVAENKPDASVYLVSFD